jgi:hypothetical protein
MHEPLVLSLEEFGCGLLFLDEGAALPAWLKAHALPDDETTLQARFSAAARTLIVRGLARVEDGKIVLDELLGRMLRVAIHPRYSLSLVAMSEQEVQSCAYHVGDEHTVVCQAWKAEGGYALAQVPFSHQHLGARAAEFFQIKTAPATDETWAVSLEQFQDLPAATDLPEAVRQWLREDYAHERMRGSLSRVERVGDSLVSDYACLILRGPERNWLFRLMPQEGRVRLRLASSEALAEELALLIERRYC